MRARYASTSPAALVSPADSAWRSSPIVAFSTQTALAARVSDAAISASAAIKQPRSGALPILGSVGGGELVLRLRLEVAGVMALMQLLGRVAGKPIDHSPTPDRGPLE